MLKSLETILEIKFSLEGIRVYEKLQHIRNAAKLKVLMKAVKSAGSPEDVLSFVDDE